MPSLLHFLLGSPQPQQWLLPSLESQDRGDAERVAGVLAGRPPGNYLEPVGGEEKSIRSVEAAAPAAVDADAVSVFAL